jgi:hypothetical protein
MSLSRKQAINELQTMFPDYDRSALDSLLRANGKPSRIISYADNLLNQTIESILSLGSSKQTSATASQKEDDTRPSLE